MDRINAMRAFVRVVEAGNFTKAADTLNVPKPNITRLVQSLEALLEIQLLHRTTRALTLTPEGAIYYERAVRLLADLDDMESTTKSSMARPSGRIKVDVSVAIGSMVVVPALPSFYAAYPDVGIDLRVSNRDVDMVAESSDCAIRIGDIADPSLVARRIGSFRFSTCAAPAYLAAHGTPEHPDALRSGHTTVAILSGRLCDAIPFAFVKGDERIEFRPPNCLSVNDTNAYLAAGVAGLGVVQGPDFSLQAAIDEGKLTALLTDWNSKVFPVSIVYPPSRFLSAKVRVFIDWAIGLMDGNLHLKRQ